VPTNQLITDASASPWKDVVLIRVVFPDGQRALATGAIVGENDILTASHVLYAAEHGGAATEVRVYPGFDDASGEDYLLGRTELRYFPVPAGPWYASQMTDDYALIGVEARFHSWFGLSSAYYENFPSIGGVQQSGYEGVLAEGHGRPVQGYTVGTAQRADAYWLTGNMAIGPGDSGSPLWVGEGAQNIVIGLASGGWGYVAAYFVAIDNDTLTTISRWRAENDHLLDGPIVQRGEYDGAIYRDTIAESSLVTAHLRGQPASPWMYALVDGREGVDTFLASAGEGAYSWERQGSGTVVLTHAPASTFYDLVHVERLAFADDRAIAFDTAGDAGQSYRLYKAAFDRTPDLPGLGYWIAQMDAGMDLVEVGARFIDSAEFRSLYGSNVSDREFVTRLYLNVLDRMPDPAGNDWWVDQLGTGARTRAKVLADFAESPENQANVATLIANGIPYEPWHG
jgi:V8-like Glu-specific endopeptidase